MSSEENNAGSLSRMAVANRRERNKPTHNTDKSYIVKWQNLKALPVTGLMPCRPLTCWISRQTGQTQPGSKWKRPLQNVKWRTLCCSVALLPFLAQAAHPGGAFPAGLVSFLRLKLTRTTSNPAPLLHEKLEQVPVRRAPPGNPPRRASGTKLSTGLPVRHPKPPGEHGALLPKHTVTCKYIPRKKDHHHCT